VIIVVEEGDGVWKPGCYAGSPYFITDALGGSRIFYYLVTSW
jgi:hypothetical protein